MLTTGQITLDSPFGKALAEYASKADSILEIGTGCGLGSTACLMSGMTRPGQRLVTIEGDYEQFLKGHDNITAAIAEAGRPMDVLAVWGILHRTIRPYWHPINTQQHKEEYFHCASVSDETIPIVDVTTLTNYGKGWDLVLLDGGEYSSDGDFLKLWQMAKVMALDDMEPLRATKNCYAAHCLKMADWKLEHSERNDRNGWQIWRKP